MEELKSLYFQIENPLDNKIKWSKVLNFYSKSLNYEDFYSAVIREKKDKKTYYDEDSKKNLKLILWSLFKNKVLSFEEKKLRKLIEDNVFSTSVYDLIKKVGDLESITSYDELKNLLTDPLINRYFYELYDDFSNEVTISSDFNILSNYRMNTIFSLRVEPKYLYNIVMMYIDECQKHEIPYHIKFIEYSKKVVINFYSTINHFKTNNSILKIVQKENNAYLFENKDLLSANLNKYIAVRNMENYSITKYSKQKTEIIFKSLDSVNYDYVVSHPNVLVAYKDGRMNIIEYLSTTVMEKIINQIINDSITSKDEYFLLANSKQFVDMKNDIKEKLMKEMPNILKDRLYLKNNDDVVPFEISENKVINIEVEIFMSAIRNLTTILMMKDNSLERYFRIRIKNECEFVGVDPSKFVLEQNFKNILFFEKEKYDKFEKEIELINKDMNKIKEYERLISQEKTPEVREQIKVLYEDVLNTFKVEESSN